MGVTLYSTMWTGDMVLGEAIVRLLMEKLEEHGVDYKLVERDLAEEAFALLIVNEIEHVKILEIQVEEPFKELAENIFKSIFEKGKLIKETALAIAREKYIKDEEELKRYREGLEETYGW